MSDDRAFATEADAGSGRRAVRTIAACIASGHDNFLLVRFVAAALVIFGHCWALARNPDGASDWLAQRTGVFSGTVAVDVFFVVSGFLVTQSYARRRSLRQFARARVLRILPGLGASVLFAALILGPLVTTLDARSYFAHGDTWRYVTGNATLIHLQTWLPGVFVDNAKTVVNGVYWTLRGEIEMYVYVALFGLLGALAGLRFALALAALLALALGSPVPLVTQAEFYGFAGFFAFGAACWVYRDRVPVSGALALALAAACVLLRAHGSYPLLFDATVAYGTLWFVFLPGFGAFNRMGDYSYGLYLYGFPMQQVVARAWPELGPWEMLPLAFPLAFACAFASWHGVEQPFLRLKSPSRTLHAP